MSEEPQTQSQETVHPRIRGEHHRRIPPRDTPYGSSPHTRGTCMRPLFYKLYNRFIPAYAGNIAARVVQGDPGAVHPRIRGEHAQTRYLAYGTTGSSPHTRGTSSFPRPRRGVVRFIPAYAGNIGATDVSNLFSSVHPRIRGEHQELCFPMKRKIGSSPHTRGTCKLSSYEPDPSRFIPAYAGNML